MCRTSVGKKLLFASILVGRRRYFLPRPVAALMPSGALAANPAARGARRRPAPWKTTLLVGGETRAAHEIGARRLRPRGALGNLAALRPMPVRPSGGCAVLASGGGNMARRNKWTGSHIYRTSRNLRRLLAAARMDRTRFEQFGTSGTARARNGLDVGTSPSRALFAGWRALADIHRQPPLYLSFLEEIYR